MSRIGGRVTNGRPSVRRMGFPSSMTWPSSCGLVSRLRSEAVYHFFELLRLPEVCRDVCPGEGMSDLLRSVAIWMSESFASTRFTIE